MPTLNIMQMYLEIRPFSCLATTPNGVILRSSLHRTSSNSAYINSFLPHYAPEAKKIKSWSPTLFETESPYYDADKSKTNGKIFILDHDADANGRTDIDDLEWSYLEGNGEF